MAFLGVSHGFLGSLLRAFWGHLGPLWGDLGALWAVLGSSWAVLRPSGGPLRPSWGDIGGPSGRLGRCEDPKSGYAKNVRFPKGMGRFLLLRGSLNGLLGCLGGLLGRLQTIEVLLGALLCCLRSPLRLSDYPSDRLESARKARQGALGGSEGPADPCQGRPGGPRDPPKGRPGRPWGGGPVSGGGEGGVSG